MEEIEKLKRELSHPEINTRFRAIEKLANLKTPPAIFPFIRNLSPRK
jgi:HEAT repeat protein